MMLRCLSFGNLGRTVGVRIEEIYRMAKGIGALWPIIRMSFEFMSIRQEQVQWVSDLVAVHGEFNGYEESVAQG